MTTTTTATTALRQTQQLLSNSNLITRFDRVIKALPSKDGQGANVLRTIGTQGLSYHQPFLLLDEFHVKPPGGFDFHPHRGFQTVTYMLGGAFKHEDTVGNSGTIHAGDVQWMTAGRGIIHSEQPATDGDNFGLQLWVNLKAKDKMIPPDYQDMPGKDLPKTKLLDGDVELTVVAGESHGLQSPIKLRTDVKFIDILITAPNVQYVDTVPASFNGLVYVISGQGKLGTSSSATLLQEKQLATFKHTSAAAAVEGEGADTTSTASGDRSLVITSSDSTSADKPLRFVLIAGENIDEPVSRYGPFVMNTDKEIQQAFIDYQTGKFAAK